MSEKYTPGPWNLKSGVDFEYKHQIRDSEEKPVVFWPVYAGQTKKTAEANARLIAAAPDLLEAIKKAEALCTSVFESNWRNWEELASPDEFERWAKRRCAHAAIYLKEAIANARLIAAAPDLLDALAVLTELVSFQICGDGHPAIINARAAIAKATGGAS